MTGKELTDRTRGDTVRRMHESNMRRTVHPGARVVQGMHPHHSIVNVAIGDAPHHIQDGLRAYTAQTVDECGSWL